MRLGLVRLLMLYKLMLWSLNTVQVMFFTGLVGCVFVVAVSWVSVSRAAFSRDKK
ncbi:MAG: hypothetical protein WBM14_17040 [Terracidiphilus sp.]|jgi:hypothetical protein